MKWRTEILAYFATGLTNGRTEGFNNKAKLVKRRAYGYRSFAKYRLRLLNAWAQRLQFRKLSACELVGEGELDKSCA